MKKVLFTLFACVTLLSCSEENKAFTGYIVAKEYTPEHMSNERAQTKSYSITSTPRVVVVPHVPARPAPPSKIRARYVWYVANKERVVSVEVTAQMFNVKKCGELVTVYR